MFRTSTLMAIALSVTAIASATSPAAAFITTVQPSQEAHHVLTAVSPPPNRVTPGSSSAGKAEMSMPKATATGTRTVGQQQAQPVVTPHCMTAADIPALAAGIDQLLPTAQLSPDDMTEVTELRQMIQDLSSDGKVAAARNVEEVAMYYLGYQKIWLQCGLGTFAWTQSPGNDAGQSSNQAVAQSTAQSK